MFPINCTIYHPPYSVRFGTTKKGLLIVITRTVWIHDLVETLFKTQNALL